MNDDQSVKADVEEEIDAVREFAKKVSPEDVKGGAWFTALLRFALETYSREATPEFFARKYPGLPPDAIADRRIELAQRYAMIEGGLTASAYTAAIAATIGSAGGASPLTLPGAAAAFTVDLFYCTRLQLRLAYDLAVIYGRPIDMNDPEDLYDLVKVAFGIKAGEALRATLPRLAPEATRQGVKAVFSGATLAFLQALPVVGRYLLQRNIIKFAVPAVGIPLSMKLNHWQTGKIGKAAREVFRAQSSIRETADRIVDQSSVEASVLLRAVWLIVDADATVHENEAWLLKSMLASLGDDDAAAGAVEQFKSMVNLDVATFESDLRAAPEPVRREVFSVACDVALIDRDLHAKEVDALRRLATVCGVEFDEAALRRRAKSS